MILTYHGAGCIRASAGDTTIVLGPISKKSKTFKPTNFGADVAFVPSNHADMNGIEEASRGEKEAFAITGPGEYEVKDISAAGFASKSHYDMEERINTIYSFTFDGLKVLYLGAQNMTDLPEEVTEMDSPDILIVPISADGTLSPAEANKVAVKLESKIVIPVFYDEKSLKQFLKESGADDVKPIDKLTVKLRDLAGKENEVVVLAH